MCNGVPQGSILGPLFSVFFSNLPAATKHCSLNMYADDMTIYHSAKDPSEVRETLEEDLCDIQSWIDENKLRLNVAKTQLMVLYRKGMRQFAQRVSVIHHGVHIAQQKWVKYLGMVIDENLNWDKHITKVKCFANLALIRRAGSYLPTTVKKCLYNALVLPHFDYCSVNCLELLQSRSFDMSAESANLAARIILNNYSK